MEVEMKLFATLRKFGPGPEKIELDEEATVADLLEKCGIPASDVAIVLVNGRHSQLEQRLSQDDSVALFPPLAGG